MKTKTFNWLLTAAMLYLVSSCAIYEGDKTTINYSDSSSQSMNNIFESNDDGKDRTVPNEQSSSTPSVIVSKKDTKIKLIKVGCSKFVPPLRTTEPTIGDEDISTIRNDNEKAVITVLLSHIRKVHSYNVEYNKHLEDALAKHYKTCNRN